MVCPFCSHQETKVIDSRESTDGKVIRRRRECLKCQKRFSTYEQLQLLNFIVVKKDGRKEDYSREKLESGIKKAFEKRPVDDKKIEEMVDEIEYKLHRKGNCEISSKEIGGLVLEKLKVADDVAYLRFASVYKSFGSAESFKKEAEKLSQA